MKKIVSEKYETFNSQRKLEEKEAAEKEALNDLKEIEKEIKELLIDKSKSPKGIKN
ncbi:hypothetical protein GP2143_02959 [marine gamma proteobacterium HTCC2143]|uniref:Uncharacterized protein n=1 Tax=marine gamma proteobacterium HTCC2143 TaxID=247633 RepID=A0YEL3_9GAMM|nr:hypothetical protein GP2143_02959 [marine gamma proteobacterium HTCC2143]